MGEGRIPVFDLNGEVLREIKPPKVFSETIFPDLILRAFLSSLSKGFQPKGTDKMAGNRRVARSLGTGRGISRVPRISGTLRAAKVSMAVGGRRAHPPKAEKKIVERINKKEKRKAIRSALAACANPSLVSARGHVINGIKHVPLVLTNELEEISRTKDVREILRKLGAWKDVERCKRRWRKIRAGKGKMRGRKRKKAKGPLIIISEDRGILKAARNIPGVDVCVDRNLNCRVLAPGGKPGRLTIWCEESIKRIDKLFGGLT